MAKARVQGKTGSFTCPVVCADWVNWDLDVSQEVVDDTSYTDSGDFTSCIGNALFTGRISAGGILNAHAASTAPGLASLTGTGGAYTCQSETGCSHTGNAVVERAAISHRKSAAITTIVVNLRTKGAIGEAWATT
jgi:hypothetical protein